MKDTETTSYLPGRNLTLLEPWEYQYYILNFACSEGELKSALHEVGNVPEDLKHRLSK